MIVFENSIHYYYVCVLFFSVKRFEPTFNGRGKRYINKHIIIRPSIHFCVISGDKLLETLKKISFC